jgi:phosphomannomutase
VSNLDAIVKAYDIRGTVPDQLDATLTHALGVAFAKFSEAKMIVVAHDMRPSGPDLVEAFQRGLTEQGVDVINLGLASTDLLYFASGVLDAPGAMFTASHNPSSYNGIKLSRAGAQSLSGDTGLFEVRDRAQDYLESGIPAVDEPGTVSERDVLAEYASYVRELVDVSRVRPLRIVIDAGNGMAGLTVPAVMGAGAPW